MRATRFALAAIVGFALAAPLTAAGTPTAPVVAGPGAWVTDYATKVAIVPVGGELDFVNADLMRHDVVAYRHYGSDDQPWCASSYPPGRCPLFWSEKAPLGQTVPVLGLDRLYAGTTYAFYCTLHDGMRGTLVAIPATE